MPRNVNNTAPRIAPITGPATQALDFSFVFVDAAIDVPEGLIDVGVDVDVGEAMNDSASAGNVALAEAGDDGADDGVVVTMVASQLPPFHSGQHW